MKKLIILLFVIFMFTSCDAKIKNNAPVISKELSSDLNFSVGELQYKGKFTCTDNDNMKIEFTAPSGVQNTVFTYSNGKINVTVEGKEIGDENSIQQGAVFIFFNAVNEMMSENTEYEYLNNQFVFFKGDNRLYVNEDGSFDRLVCGVQCFYFFK